MIPYFNSRLPVSAKTNLSHYEAIILANIPDIVVTTDVYFHITTWNKIAEQVFSLKEKDVIGKRFSSVVQFDFLDDTLEQSRIKLSENGIWKGEVIYSNKEGRKLYFLYIVRHLLDDEGQPSGILAIGRDITAQKEAELRLEHSERFYRSLIADSIDGILLVNEEGTITFSSPSVKHVLGYDSDELIGKQAFNYVHPDELVLTNTAFQREVFENPEVKFIIVRLLKKNGEWLWCVVRGHNMLRVPSVNAIAIHFHDDSLRKKASEALKESENRFRTLISELQVGVLMVNADSKIVLCNKAAERLSGLSAEELLNRYCFDPAWQIHKEDGSLYSVEEYPLLVSIKTKKPVRDIVMGVFRPSTNEIVWLLTNAEPVLNANGELHQLIASFVDITERKKLEQHLLGEQLAHQRQLTQTTIDSQEKERTEIGKELHDNIGQQLTTVKLYLDLAKSTADDTTAEMVAVAQRGISDVINEIRSLCRALIPSSLGDIGLIESVNDLVHTMTRTRQVRIKLSWDQFDEETIAENQKLMLFRILQEQLNNILKHAAAERVSVLLRNNSSEVIMEIIDDGKGFDISKVKKGLGLTNMRNRAEMFGGKVSIKSSPGEGCHLIVNIPAIAPDNN